MNKTIFSYISEVSNSDGDAKHLRMISEIKMFLVKNPNPSDGVLHAWAEKSGYDVHKVEEEVYKLAYSFVRFMMVDGLSNKKKVNPDTLNRKLIEKGVSVELEHTDSPELARKIALDHMTENPKYYIFLEKMEQEMNSGVPKSDQEPKQQLPVQPEGE